MLHSAVVSCSVMVAVVAALRSTWSPCGISMLSTLTPYGERSRGHRYSATVLWFVAGAAAGGLALGALAAGLAALAGLVSWSASATAGVAIAAAAVCVGSDLRLGGLHLPAVPRQVNEVWVRRYRRWVYATGFGAQIGVGLSTYVMTAGVYLMIVLAALTTSPLTAALIATGFGVARGLAILLGARLRSPAAIRRFHERFEGLASASLATAVVVQLGVLEYAGAALGIAGAIAASAVVVGTGALTVTRRRTAAAHRITVGART